MLDSLVGFVICRLEFAVWAVVGVRLVMETAIGQGTAETLVEEQEQERDLHTLGGELVSA